MSNQTVKIIKSLGRYSKIRMGIVDILLKNKCLMTKSALVKNLNAKLIKPNRSTIYRELVFLEKNNIIKKNTILGSSYYELPQDHHHHLVCCGCGLIQKINIGNCLAEKEKIISKKNNFNITHHTLEFYGYCLACTKLKTGLKN